MEIIPAIDIRGGRCVRLYQGDYSQETVFNEDPMTAALTWYSRVHAGSTLWIWTGHLPVNPRIWR